MLIRASAMVLMAVAAPAMAQDAPAPKPKPIGNPGEWIPLSAYPPGARASGEEGRVAFTLDVDETGRATECKVTTTSESPLLDETTCSLMVANARFEPPRDKKNKPIESKWSSSVRWKLEAAPPVDPASPVPAAGPAPVAPKPLPPVKR